MGHGVHFPISVCVLFNPAPGILSSEMTFVVAAVDKWMVALERNDFSKRTLFFLDFTQCSQSTKYLFALGADLAVIHSPSSLFEIAEQAPQFDDLMICCMTGKQSPQESKNCMHPRDLFSRHPVLFGWRNVRAQSELKRPFRTQQRQEI